MAGSTTVRHPKDKKGSPLAAAHSFVWAVLESSVGAKVVVALSGLAVTAFAVVHMIGNLKVFSGPDSINAYAHFLKHDLGVLIWVARAGLLGVFLLHVVLALRLTLRARAARPVGYVYPGHVQATAVSRTMIYTGIVLGLFVLFHLAHYTFGWVKGAEAPDGRVYHYLELRDHKDRHDVYSMVIAGFTTPWVSVLYIVANLALFAHLLHGVQSAFQTLGLKNGRFAPVIWFLGFGVAALILAGNLAIVIGVWAGLYPVPPTYRTV